MTPVVRNNAAGGDHSHYSAHFFSAPQSHSIANVPSSIAAVSSDYLSLPGPNQVTPGGCFSRLTAPASLIPATPKPAPRPCQPLLFPSTVFGSSRAI